MSAAPVAENRPSTSPEIDVYSAPDDYEQLYEQYYGFVVGLLIKLGIHPQNAEATAQDIFVRFIATDILEQFDGSLVFSRSSGKVRARFKSFLAAKVEHYARGKRGRQAIVARREPLLCDAPAGDGTASWIEAFGVSVGAAVEDDTTGVEAREMVQKIRGHLVTLPVRGKRDLVKLFDGILRQLGDGATKPDRKELASEFGVSDTAIGSMIQDLRAAVTDALEETS